MKIVDTTAAPFYLVKFKIDDEEPSYYVEQIVKVAIENLLAKNNNKPQVESIGKDKINIVTNLSSRPTACQVDEALCTIISNYLDYHEFYSLYDLKSCKSEEYSDHSSNYEVGIRKSGQEINILVNEGTYNYVRKVLRNGAADMESLLIQKPYLPIAIYGALRNYVYEG